jgi:Peptidase family C50
MLFISKERKFNYYVSKITFSDYMREKLNNLVERLALIKTTMQKTPITIEEDLHKLEAESERDIALIMLELESFFEPVTSSLDSIINPPVKVVQEEEEQIAQAAPGKGAPAPKKDDKKAPPAKAPPAGKPAAGGKGAPGELAAYESNLPLPTSGIESIVLLLDHRIESLPFEHMKVFSKIPSISRDFNLHLHMQRLKSIGH